VGYARVPSVRETVDAKAPWFKEKVGHYLHVGTAPAEGDAPAADRANVPPSQPVDFATVSGDPSRWPASVTLKTSVDFPAVLKGTNKTLGTIRAPIGSEVHLVKIQGGMLGVEYQGGGKWVSPDATDLMDRVQSGLPPRQ